MPDFANLPLGHWRNLAGNTVVRDTLRGTLSKGGKMFLVGPPGSGKSAIVNHGVRAFACYKPIDFEPCGDCKGCHGIVPRESCDGIFAYLRDRDREIPFHYLAINCRNVTPNWLLESIGRLFGSDGTVLIHLEEAKELRRLDCDIKLTEVMDHPATANWRWIATAVNNQGLDPQFCRRMTIKSAISKPSQFDLAAVIARRCHQFQIAIDHPATLQELADAAWRVPGIALGALQSVFNQEPPRLTDEVLNGPFQLTDPWADAFFC